MTFPWRVPARSVSESWRVPEERRDGSRGHSQRQSVRERYCLVSLPVAFWLAAYSPELTYLSTSVCLQIASLNRRILSSCEDRAPINGSPRRVPVAGVPDRTSACLQLTDVSLSPHMQRAQASASIVAERMLSTRPLRNWRKEQLS